MTIQTEVDLATAVWTARTEVDVKDILVAAEAIYGPIETRPVGNRANNSGIIRVSSEPMLALVERITNAIDACLELRSLETGSSEPNPRAAARKWFKVPEAGLVALSDTERRSLAENNIWVVMEDSGDPKRPTVTITDRGIGLHPSDFPKTILSLNESNKVQAAYTMGTFGQGGSAALGFSRSTVIVSRRHGSHLGERQDQIGWTIATEYFDESTMKVPSYVYYAPVDHAGVFWLDADTLPDLEHGTRVTHIAYDAQKGATAYTTGAWQIFNATLFDPVLPFVLGGNRPSDPEWKANKMPTRIITGTATRLGGAGVGGGQIELAHRDAHEIELGAGLGSVSIAYWALRRPEGSTSSSDITRSYVEASAAVSMTLFGQRQDATPRSWIKDQALLPFLYKNIIVQIDADRLSGMAKRELFVSTRERATESDLRRQIYETAAQILRADEMLKFLNHEEKERLLKKSSAATNDKVRKRLAKFVKTKLKDVQKAGSGGSSSGTGGGKTSKPGKPVKPRDTSDDHLPATPTEMSFDKSTIKLQQGRQSSLWLCLNAKNGFLPAQNDYLTISWPLGDGGGKVRLASRSHLAGGMSRWAFTAEADAPLGTVTLAVQLITPSGLLHAALDIEVIVPPPANQNTKATEPETGPEVRWVGKDDWEDHEFTERHVGRVFEDEESTVIFVNRDYRILVSALSGRTLTSDQITTRADRYQYPVACALWLQSHEIKKLAAEQRPSDEYQILELERVAEAVLLASDPDVSIADEDET
jgi:hypothetical protein